MSSIQSFSLVDVVIAVVIIDVVAVTVIKAAVPKLCKTSKTEKKTWEAPMTFYVLLKFDIIQSSSL